MPITKGVPFNIATNFQTVAAPPTYFLPNTTGEAVPAGCTQWLLEWDQTNMPDQSPFVLQIEYQRPAWTEPNGTQHPNNEWLPDAGFAPDNVCAAQIPLKGGGFTFTNSLLSEIADTSGIMPYPRRVRIRVDTLPSWLTAFVRITLF